MTCKNSGWEEGKENLPVCLQGKMFILPSLNYPPPPPTTPQIHKAYNLNLKRGKLILGNILYSLTLDGLGFIICSKIIPESFVEVRKGKMKSWVEGLIRMAGKHMS